MRGRRMGRPGLVGTMARTAVVAGTATAVSGKVHAKQAASAQAAANEQQAAAVAQQAAFDQAVAEQVAAQAPPPPAPAAAAPAADDTMEQLQKLADMKLQGLLSDEEFAAMKAKLLGL